MAEKLVTANVLRDTAFEELTFGAGIVVDHFDPETLEVGSILWATNSGLSFSDSPEFTDYGEDIDNCPENTMQLKRRSGRAVVVSGTALTVTKETVAKLMGGADIDGVKIVPRDKLKEEDFADAWIITDHGDDEFLYIHLMNTLNTSGFSMTTGKDAKGTFPFELTAHYDIKKQDVVPYEVGIVTIS